MNLKNQLTKMDSSDLKFVCKELGIPCPKTKKRIIDVLLSPLNKSYKMNMEIVEESDDDIPSDWEDDEVMKRIDEKNATETIQQFMKKYLRRLKSRKKRKKKSKRRELTKKEKERKEKNRRIQEYKKKQKEQREKEQKKKEAQLKKDYNERKKRNKEQMKLAKQEAREKNRKRGDAFEKIKKRKVESKKTKMCKHGQKCKRKKTCNFAHSRDELQVVNCAFKKNCRRPDCYFNHPDGRYIDQKPSNIRDKMSNYMKKRKK